MEDNKSMTVKKTVKSGMSLRFSELDLPQKNIFPIPARSKLSQKQKHNQKPHQEKG